MSQAKTQADAKVSSLEDMVQVLEAALSILQKSETEFGIQNKTLEEENEKMKLDVGHLKVENEYRPPLFPALNSYLFVLSLMLVHEQQQSQNKQLMVRIQALEKQVAQYQDEKKEREIELNKLREENKKLKLQCVDTLKYHEWGPDEMCEWILGLVKYEQVLRESLKEEEADGSLLGAVDSADLKGWGIIKLSDRKFLQNEIASLVGNQSAAANPASNIVTNEGAKVTAYV